MMCHSLSFKNLFSAVLLGIFLISCESDDIDPALSLDLDNTELSELGGIVTLNATLNGAATETIDIPLNISGTATSGVDYAISSTNITINQGQTSGFVTITGLEDGLIEGEETIEIALSSVTNVILLSDVNLSITLLDADVDSDGDGVPDALDDCPNLSGDPDNNGCPFLGFLINEVLYDPASGIEGDANGDGTRDPLEDEFIEFFNSGPELDISGYTISDASQVRHMFPEGTIVPMNGVIVVFGGGNPTGSFGGAMVQTTTGGQLNMSNAGDFVTVQDANSNVIATFDITPLSGNPNEAYTRNPDIFGEFERHPDIPEANGALQSPGTKIDGSSF